jgi:hypothetical protein
MGLGAASLGVPLAGVDVASLGPGGNLGAGRYLTGIAISVLVPRALAVLAAGPAS